MRSHTSVLAVALLVAACGDREPRPATERSNGTMRGPDPIVLRIPRTGGAARGYVYPALDSVVWRGPSVSAIDRALAFDPEAGLLSFVTASGNPARLDLRLARVSIASRGKLTSISSADGNAIYAVDGPRVRRFTPAGDWDFTPPAAPRSVIPQPDGSLIVTAREGGRTTVWRMRAPDTTLLDTAYLPAAGTAVRNQIGDRVYFMTDTALIGIAGRDLSVARSVRFRSPVIAVAPTPSGDRIYVANRDAEVVSVIDRYSGRLTETIKLPARPRELRMDPLGRYLLVRPASGDSAWMIAVGTNRLIGSAETEWKSDLPTVAPDGAVVTLRGADVEIVEPESLQSVRTVKGGGRDFWYFTSWNGFRARPAGLDRPVDFTQPETLLIDSVAPPPVDSAPPPRTGEPAPRPPPPAPVGYTVSFAAMLSEDAAIAAAREISLRSSSVRVVATQTAGTRVYRVIAGPFALRAEAERVGRESGRPYWVYEGEP
ncbi:MAG: SPOR domain-containing protein [Gemmatimonadaceae bacterium]|nr:SPOR domain-containing protein [Gemmatimonadaceae bacterium]